MFFSIIIPIYNSESTLKRCLESVKKQEFQEFEVILVNDGSSDKSEEICIEYSLDDERFRYYKQKNSGVSAARNFGILKAKGEYITFLDSDDIYFKDYLSSFYKAMQEYPEYGHYWCGFQYFSLNSLENGTKVSYSDEEAISFSDREEIMKLHNKVLDASPVNKVYKRSLLMEYNICMNSDISLGEDLIFNFQYLDVNDNNKILIINEPKYGYYCFSDLSLNHRYRSDLLQIYKYLIKCMNFYLLKWNVSKEQSDLFQVVKFYMYDSVLRNTFNKNNRDSFLKKIKFNNKVLQYPDFKESMNSNLISIHKVYLFAYRLGRYEVIVLIEMLFKLIKYMRRK